MGPVWMLSEVWGKMEGVGETPDCHIPQKTPQNPCSPITCLIEDRRQIWASGSTPEAFRPHSFSAAKVLKRFVLSPFLMVISAPFSRSNFYRRLVAVPPAPEVTLLGHYHLFAAMLAPFLSSCALYPILGCSVKRRPLAVIFRRHISPILEL